MKAPALLFCLGILGAPPISAQAIRGRVIDSIAHAPVAGALVEVQDASTKPIAQTFTSSTGTFLIRLVQPSRVIVRVAAIGFHPRNLDPVDLTSGVVTLPDLQLGRVILALPDLVAVGSERQCRVSDSSATIMGQVLANARNALQVIDGIWQSHAMEFEVEEVHRTVLIPANGPEQVMVSDTTRRSLQVWPIRSLPPDSLRTGGFGWAFANANGPGRVYWGPDARVLFADWFLATHCFALTIGKEARGPNALHVRFEPERRSRLVDIDGEIVLDPTTLAPVMFSYRHRNLPDEIPDGAAGGTMAFSRLDNGAWIPMAWSIWAPIQRRQSQALLTPEPRTRIVGRSVFDHPPAHQGAVIGREERTGRVVNAKARSGN